MSGKTRISVGERYGRLFVTSLSYVNKHKKRVWNLLCDCGSITEATTQKLVSGHTKSCGCLSKEVARKNRLQEAVHGHTSGGKMTKTYSTWRAMHNRCLNPNTKDYKNYGGRGIFICDEWLNFEKFLADMGERPDNTTIDRIDVNKGYYPENCRWATQAEQDRNKRTTKLSLAQISSLVLDTRENKEIANQFGITLNYVRILKKRYKMSQEVNGGK